MHITASYDLFVMGRIKKDDQIQMEESYSLDRLPGRLNRAGTQRHGAVHEVQ